VIKIKKMTNKLSTSCRVALLTACSTALLMTTPSIHAAQFGVSVIDSAGQPVSGASVCLGIHGKYAQYGSARTDENGQVLMDVPRVPMILTISKNSFSSVRTSEPARGFNLIKQIELSKGHPNVLCQAGSPPVSESSVRIGNVLVSESTFSTVLEPTVSGEPTQYRVSRSPSFTGSKWQRFESTIALSTRLSEENEVYLQMRRYKGTSKSWIEARSEVVSVRLPEFQ